jgi:anti-anti-sigma factor
MDTQPLKITTHDSYDIVSLQGAVTLNLLPVMTPTISSHLQKNISKNLVFDLSAVPSVDSCVIRLFVNIHKRLVADNRKLYILSPADYVKDLLLTVNLDKVLNVFHNITELQQDIDENVYKRYLPFTFPDKDQLRIRLSCAVCGSYNVTGYHLNANSFKWKWQEEDFFPFCEDLYGKYFNYFSVLPIVCQDCLAASIDIKDFNILNNDNSLRFESHLDERSKFALSKNVKKRKKMMEAGVAVGDNFFHHPRDKYSSFSSYMLAESCVRSLSDSRNESDSFSIGYLNYLALQFASDSQKSDLINNCRTWLTQTMNNSGKYNHIQLSQMYYILMISYLSIQKPKETEKIYSTFSDMIKTLPSTDLNSNRLTSPFFWFSKAQAVFKKEFENS